jgi:hypothetical protein
VNISPAGREHGTAWHTKIHLETCPSRHPTIKIDQDFLEKCSSDMLWQFDCILAARSWPFPLAPPFAPFRLVASIHEREGKPSPSTYVIIYFSAAWHASKLSFPCCIMAACHISHWPLLNGLNFLRTSSCPLPDCRRFSCGTIQKSCVKSEPHNSSNVCLGSLNLNCNSTNLKGLTEERCKSGKSWG